MVTVVAMVTRVAMVTAVAMVHGYSTQIRGTQRGQVERVTEEKEVT